MDKMLVFIDLDNIYRGLVEHYGVEPIENEFNMFEIIRNYQKEKGNQISEIIAFGDFDKMGSNSFKTNLAMEGIQPKDVFSTNSTIKRKNASDIQLSIYAVDCAFHLNDVNKYLFISADADMIPIISYLKGNGHRKQVSLYVLEKQANVRVLEKFPNDEFSTLEKILSLKEPEIISDEIIESNQKLLVHRILITEQYNIKSKRDRQYYTMDGYKWNEMRFLKLGEKRLNGKDMDKIIKSLQDKEIIFVKYNPNLKSEEIILNRENKIVQGVLEKFID